ncbi:MAG: SpoIIE family protein phosphatase [Candidatus Eremiobacteraeota bacterium]|nr:SpoIIE family protein phosphatase [Candidatus Eremiobacteraeota bacterium]
MNFVATKDPEQAAVDGFQTFAEALPCIVWIADGAGRIEWYNHEFRAYTGRMLQAEVGWGWMPSVHLDDRKSITREWAHSLASGTVLDSVVRLRGDHGSYRWFSVRARPFYDPNGTIAKWFGTLTDIHDRQIAVEANTHMVDAMMKGYLSKTFPTVKGLTFDTLYRAANVMEKIGGDWYDVFKLPDGRIGFSLGDVCGHGVDAAVKMSEAKQAIFVAACLGDPAPESVLCQANRVLFLNNHHVSITTALYGIVDVAHRTVTYASAGHHPPILARPNEQAEVLPNHGFPLGVEEHMPPRIKPHEFTYEFGSTMVLYTDGLIEFDHDLIDGEGRLLAAAAESVRCGAAHPAKFIANHVLGDATPIDDVAVLTLSFVGD